MVCIRQEKCFKCKGTYTTANGKGECPKCYPKPKKKEFHCPGCCICMGGWIPPSERRY